VWVDGAARLRLVGDQPVGVVEEQDAELLDLLARQHRGQIPDQARRVCQHGHSLHTLPRQPQRRLVQQLDRREAVRAEAVEAPQLGQRRRQQGREAAEAGDCLAGKRRGILACRHRGTQQQGQQVGIPDRGVLTRQQPRAHRLHPYVPSVQRAGSEDDLTMQHLRARLNPRVPLEHGHLDHALLD